MCGYQLKSSKVLVNYRPECVCVCVRVCLLVFATDTEKKRKRFRTVQVDYEYSSLRKQNPPFLRPAHNLKKTIGTAV